jgi:transcriptional regulator GlxA family with amidase domain
LVVDEGDVYTGGGINAAADLALYLVEKLAGSELAKQCAKSLLIEMPRTWQTAFSDFAIDTNHDDAGIARAQEWLHDRFDQEVNLDALAAHVGMSSRTFNRRFKAALGCTPLAYLQSLRVAAAKRLLENGRMAVSQVMAEVGYEDPVFFRSLFKRFTGMAPSDYRQRFAPPTVL